MPHGIDRDPAGNIYVTDTGNDRVQKFDSSGNFISQWGIPGSGPGQLDNPAGIAVDPASGAVYVADVGNNRIQKFTSAGMFVTAWGTSGSGLGQLNGAYGVAVDSAGNVFVADTGNARVQWFTSTGTFIDTVGAPGTGEGQFTSPIDVEVGSGDAVYVLDRAANRYQRFVKGGAVVVTLDSQPDDPQSFIYTAGGGLSPLSRTLNDYPDPTPNTGRFTGPAGSGYSVTQSQPGGWESVGATCSDGSAPSNIDLSLGEVVNCNFTNRKLGQIRVVEDAQPNDPQDFSFTAGGGITPTSFQLDDDLDNNNGLANSRLFSDVQPGTYSIAQTTPAGWDPAQVSCSDGSSPSNIDVSYAEIVTCTFTNVVTDRGFVTIRLDQQPDSGDVMPYTLDGNSVRLNDNGTSSDGFSNERVAVVRTGSHTLVLTSNTTTPVGRLWMTSSSSCSDGSSITSIDVSLNENVTCTVIAVPAGTLSVHLTTDPVDPQDFSFTAGPGLSPASFTLDHDGISSNPYDSSQSFGAVPAGSGYSVAEFVPAGWDLTSATCNDGSPVTNITISHSENVFCTFVNKRPGSIRVVVDAQPDDPRDFSFTAGGGLSPSTVTLDDDGGENNPLPSSQDWSNVPAGSGYSVTENLPATWALQSATCSDGSPVTNIDLSGGENVTCTFVNIPNTAPYPRPLSATPVFAPLVLAYDACASPTTTHAPPLGGGSCPAQTSSQLTVGTADSNARPTKATGSLKIGVIAGDPAVPGDQADLRFTASLTDIRNKSDLSDYPGELVTRIGFRITDKSSGTVPSGQESGTVADITYSLAVPCEATQDTTVGSDCSLVTTADTVAPGAAIEGRRAIWQSDQVRVYDGGNSLFMVQGIFAP